MTLSGVKCTVQSCRYWQQGERCNASAIEVNVDGGSTQAVQSEETNCRTFAPQ